MRLADGTRRDLPVVAGVMIEILGRTMSCDAIVTPAGSTPLIGQIAFDGLDLVVIPGTREVGPNPANPDGPVYDLLAELDRRAQAVADGTAKLVDWEDARERIASRLKARREARTPR